MAASSSATRMLPAGIGSSLGSAARLGVVTQVHGHENSEDGVSWLRLTFDDPAVVAHDLGHQCKSEARAAALGRDKRVEEVRQEVLGNSVTVVAHAEFQRQRDSRLAAG